MKIEYENIKLFFAFPNCTTIQILLGKKVKNILVGQ